MVLIVGLSLAGLIGARFLLAPAIAAGGFGIAGAPALSPGFSAWLATKGVRDIASGLFIFLMLAEAPHPLAGAFLLVASLIPIGDAVIVRRSGGSTAAALGIHGATAVVVIAAGLCLLAS